MKKTGILIGILIVLSGLAYLLIKSDKSSERSSIDLTDRNFAVEKKEDIHRIVLKRRNRDTLEFTRQDKIWMINNTYEASEFVMPHLLTSLKKVEIDFIPQKAANVNILNEMDRIGIEVEVYDKNDKLLRAYTVGGDTADGYGTYYLLKGADQPYVMHMRAHSGGLRGRFVYDLDVWRSTAIFRAKLEDIESLSITYPKNKTASFKIVKENGTYNVSPGNQFTPTSSKEVNQETVKGYLTHFDRLFGEGNENTNIRKDSILRVLPFATVKLKLAGQEMNQYDFIPLQSLQGLRNTVTDFDDLTKLERFFVGINHKEMMLAQQRVIGKIFRPYSFFFE